MSTRITRTFEPMKEQKSFASMEPGIYEGTLAKVENYDNGRTSGWIFTYDVDGLPFKDWVTVQQNTMWKVESAIRPFDPDAADLVTQGVLDVDPSEYVGLPVMLEIGYSERTNADGIPYKQVENTWSVNITPPTRTEFPEPEQPDLF